MWSPNWANFKKCHITILRFFFPSHSTNSASALVQTKSIQTPFSCRNKKKTRQTVYVVKHMRIALIKIKQICLRNNK